MAVKGRERRSTNYPFGQVRIFTNSVADGFHRWKVVGGFGEGLVGWWTDENTNGLVEQLSFNL